MKKIFTFFAAFLFVATISAVNPKSKVLSFSSSDVNTSIQSTITKTTNYFGNSFTWTLTASGTTDYIQIVSSSKVCDSISFAYRVNPEGTGSYGSYRTIEFAVNPGDTVVVYAVAGTSANARWLRLQRSSTASDTVGIQAPISTYSVASTVKTGVTNTVPKLTFPVITAAGTADLYSTSGGMYIYRVEINPQITTTGINNVTVNNGKVIKTEYYTITGCYVGTDSSILSNGFYVKKLTYDNGAVTSNKIFLKK
jgi:hypothetical protein